METDAGKISGDLYEVVGKLTQWLRCHGGELSPTAAAVLVRLARHGPARASALAAHVRVALPTMTALLTRLAGQELVRRETNRADGRAAGSLHAAAGGQDRTCERVSLPGWLCEAQAAAAP
ncbi:MULTISPECIES: MarR family winged helix-turn-helix transcriptional regulator [Amycolatopsis]|uniref:HTH marR-type domain-containing protein n=1 Tax=Amycolatopsis bullii TaxID=941987 RepID=A0ABQ3JXN5_9PSEU|nr:MarR family transcriptional regulator [Amycolatopsis bullii]GHF93885.1 hypothetical protein GCM10017567_05380 [Amycolatopsis bullii]